MEDELDTVKVSLYASDLRWEVEQADEEDKKYDEGGVFIAGDKWFTICQRSETDKAKVTVLTELIRNERKTFAESESLMDRMTDIGMAILSYRNERARVASTIKP